MKIGNKEFDLTNGCYIMGILNVTPDSFSDGSQFNSLDNALFHTEQMINEGADIIDIGGESTRPNHIKISIQEEIDRVAPYIEKIKETFDIPVSLDTYKPDVLSVFVDKIDLINDIWGLKYDSRMANIVASSNLPYILMHNRKNIDYNDFLTDVVNDIKDSLEIAKNAGIKRDKIIIDGGIGFAKTYEQNLLLLQHIDLLNQFSCPQMMATSRKSVFGLTLDNEPKERDLATAVSTTIGVLNDVKFFRVHDVKSNLEAIKVTKSIMEGKKWIR